MKPALALLLALGLLSMASATGESATITYQDPGGSFILQIPPGWEVQNNLGVDSCLTMISSAAPVGKLGLLVIPSPPLGDLSKERLEALLRESARSFFEGWVKALQDQGQVRIVRKVYKTRFKGVEALRLDLSYHRKGEQIPRQAFALYFFGDHTTFFVSIHGDKAGFRQADEILSTLQIEPAR